MVDGKGGGEEEIEGEMGCCKRKRVWEDLAPLPSIRRIVKKKILVIICHDSMERAMDHVDSAEQLHR